MLACASGELTLLYGTGLVGWFLKSRGPFRDLNARFEDQ